MGTSWQYKPTNEVYKSGTELIQILIETRAKGGNLLLNVGHKPTGQLPVEQEDRLRQVIAKNIRRILRLSCPQITPTTRWVARTPCTH